MTGRNRKNHVKCVGCNALSDMNLVLESIYLVFTVYILCNSLGREEVF